MVFEDYDGAHWRGGALTPSPACLYITESSICLDSSEKLVYPFKDITSITKDTTVPLISNGILKFQTRQGKSFMFLLYKGANKAHDTLESVWTANLNHWQNQLASASESSNSFAKPSVASSSSSAPASPDPKAILASKNTALLKRANAIQAFSSKFLVPEEPVSEYIVSLVGLPGHSPMLVGSLTLTSSFVCWTNNTIGSSRMQLVISAASILQLSVQELVFGLGPKSHVVIETEEGNRFTFMSAHPNQLWEEVSKMRERHQAYIARMKDKFPATYSTLPRNGYQENIERESNADHQDVQLRLQTHWEGYFKIYGRGPSMIVATEQIHNLLKLGIPDIYRHEVWPLMCGATHKLNANAGQYQEYLSQESVRTSQASQDIDKDLHRSMPAHPYYSNQPKNLEPLRNVLLAYAARNPAVGYCQGMNIVAAMLLLYLSEEVAFWVLTSIIEEIAPDYYNKQLFGSQVDQKVFNRLVKSKYPDLYTHLKDIGMPLHLLTLPWFMTFLIDCVPWDASLIVLDNLLRNGTAVLFQVALSILTITYNDIMAEKSENEQIPLLIRSHPFDSYELINMAFTKFGYIDVESIRRMRREGKAARLNDMQEAAHKQALGKVKRKFKTSWKEDQIDEVNRHYLSQGRGEMLSLNAFKQILLIYLTHIERNVIKLTKSDSTSTLGSSASSVPTSPTPGLTPTVTPSILTDVPLPLTTSPHNPVEAANLTTNPHSLLPIESPIPIVPTSPAGVSAPAALSPAFEEEVIQTIWNHQRGNQHGVDLLGLVTILDILLNQTPAQIFTWLEGILYPTDKYSQLDRTQFERLLLALYILNYAGEAPITSNIARIQTFIPLVYEQMGGNAITLTFEQLQDLVVNCELLEGFWSRLYYIDLGSSNSSLPMPSSPFEEGDLMSFH